MCCNLRQQIDVSVLAYLISDEVRVAATTDATEFERLQLAATIEQRLSVPLELSMAMVLLNSRRKI
jgi:hypothetical protein